jgi:hypothetical protein
MEPMKIMLKQEDYKEYLQGREVECSPERIPDKNIAPGDRIMVFKNTIASRMDVATPTREQQSDYLGLEGTVLHVNTLSKSIDAEDSTLQSIIVKKI